MKLLLLSMIIISIFITPARHAMLPADFFKMPNKDNLEKRLKENGFEYLLEKTDLISRLAGKDMLAVSIGMHVALALDAFSQKVGPRIYESVKTRKNELLEVLLQDYPQALVELQELEMM